MKFSDLTCLQDIGYKVIQTSSCLKNYEGYIFLFKVTKGKGVEISFLLLFVSSVPLTATKTLYMRALQS